MEAPSSAGQGATAGSAPSVNGDAASENTISHASASATDTHVAAASDPVVNTSNDAKQDNSAPPPALQPTDDATGPVPQAAVSKSTADEIMAEAPIYGTRSRNRTGNNRPNYAEDQDMDFEYSVPSKTDPKRIQTTTEVKRPQDSNTSKVLPVNGDGRPEKPVPKDVPGTSSFPATTSKKRKAAAGLAGQGAASSGTATPINRTGTPSNVVSDRVTNTHSFSKSKAQLKNGKLISDDGTAFSVNDHVYLICEPPGDPYYLCRIMEFLHAESDDPASPIDSIRVNWFYRPRDVQRYNNDTRLIYGTMHSDLCPLTSLRGKCQILHRSEIDDLDEYRKGKDCFWFGQIVDRFIKRFYEVVPTSQIINVPDKVKKALDERWKFIAVETGRVKELTSAVKLCKRCSQYCASHDSVDCAICRNSYHMNCVRPPLPKKPSRGFAWACGPCSRAQEKRLEARHTPTLGANGEREEEEVVEEEEEDPALSGSTRAPSPDGSEMAIDQHPGTQAEIALAKMWPMRYLGIHCRVEDALQYDDRAIYPRASSRLGPRHQANVNVWHGRPVELVTPMDIKKKYVKTTSHKKDAKLSKETVAALEADRAERATRPKWVLDAPPGYVARGEDYDNNDSRNTAQLMFKMPETDADHPPAANEVLVDDFIQKVKGLSQKIRVAEYGANLKDKALSLLIDNKYDAEKTLLQVAKLDRGKDLKEPIFTPDDLKKFEDGVSKYGSEHRLVKQHMKTNLPISSIIRFYYLWKKTPRGRQIWDNYGGRKGTKKKQSTDAASELHGQVADDADDSAFDSGKASAHKREFQCKFCSSRSSRQWRRAPGVSPGQTAPAEGKSGVKEKGNRPLLALCLRCASLWRRYAIQWEEIEEVAKKVAQGGGRAWKRRIDEELLRELLEANEPVPRSTPDAPNTTVQMSEGAAEPPKKKTKTGEVAKKDKPVAPPKLPSPPPPPIIPEPPKWRTMPCQVCNVLENAGQLPVSCTHCKLSVHKRCYGLADQVLSSKWVCDQCSNDRNPVVSTDYTCLLCPTEFTPLELWEAPKVTHKKKNDRDREKERLEKDLLDKAKHDYVGRQLELSRPVQPREPLKRTDGNNWTHVTCSIWTPEIKFSNAITLERAEGFSTIPVAKYEAVCKICKNKEIQGRGACTSCLQCHANFHVSCAHELGYTFGFDVTPVKGSRKDQITTVTLGQETGYLTAAIWCKDHSIKTIVHPMDELVNDTGKTALQLYVENYKQADRTLTGTARKANLLSQSTRVPVQQSNVTVAANRRVSTISITNGSTGRKGRNSSAGLATREDDTDGNSPTNGTAPEVSEKKCVTCGVDVSPKWWPAEKRPGGWSSSRPGEGMNGVRAMPLVSGDGVKTEASNEGTAPGSHETSNQQAPTGLECHKCHWRAINKPNHTTPSQPPPFPVQLDWAVPNGQPHSVPGMSQPPVLPEQPVPLSAGPPALPPNAPLQLPPIDQLTHPHLHAPGSLPPPQTMQPNGLAYGQPVRPPPPQANPPPSAHHYHQQRPPPFPNFPSRPEHITHGSHSPGYAQQSPNFMGAPPPQQQSHYAPPRSTESPYPPPPPPVNAGGPPMAPHGQHGSPPTSFVRPTTPRDPTIDARVGGGASASPSLRNLLH